MSQNNQSIWRFFSWTTACSFFILVLGACQLSDNKIRGNYSSDDTNPLIITNSENQVLAGNTLQLIPLGGSGSYAFSILSGAGSVDENTGLYTSDNTFGVVLIQVEDSEGNQNTIQIEVVWSGISSIDNILGDGFTLHWPAVPEALGYEIYNVSTATPVFLTFVSGSDIDYTLTGLTPSQKHSFRVRVVTPGSIDFNVNDKSATTVAVVATHLGWEHVKALGGRNPVAHATGLTTISPSIYFKWKAMTFDSGSPSNYNIYRSTLSGGQDFAAPLASGVSTANREYTDLAVVVGTTYYYIVRPAIGSADFSTIQVDSEIKITLPPANMVLVHRWIANQEMCGLMGEPIDRDSNYRCNYTGFGGDGTFFDLGTHLLVDTVELGCNYSDGNLCDDGVPGPCLGNGGPNATITAPIDTVYYDRNSTACWINLDGSTSWKNTNDGSLLPNHRVVMASNRPGLPPLVSASQTQFWNTCTSFIEPGFTGNKRLLSRKEWLLAGAFDSSLSDVAVSSLQYDPTALSITMKCNTNNGSGLVFDNNDVPADLETLPALLSTSREEVRTGSMSTSNCVSRYGAQDIVGNVSEFTSDQTSSSLGIASSLSGTDDWQGWNGTGYSGGFSGLETYFLPAMGLPWPSNASGTVLSSSMNNIRGDYFSTSNGAQSAAMNGGSSSSTSLAGRFGLVFTNGSASNFGGRCGLDIGP